MNRDRFISFTSGSLIRIFHANNVPDPSPFQAQQCEAMLAELDSRLKKRSLPALDRENPDFSTFGYESPSFESKQSPQAPGCESSVFSAFGHENSPPCRETSSPESGLGAFNLAIIACVALALIFAFTGPPAQQSALNKAAVGALLGGAGIVALFIAKFIFQALARLAASVDNATSRARSKLKDLTYPISNNSHDDKFYEAALDELNSGKVEQATYAKAVVLSNGNPERLNAAYIKLRVAGLRSKTAKE